MLQHNIPYPPEMDCNRFLHVAKNRVLKGEFNKKKAGKRGKSFCHGRVRRVGVSPSRGNPGSVGTEGARSERRKKRRLMKVSFEGPMKKVKKCAMMSRGLQDEPTDDSEFVEIVALKSNGKDETKERVDEEMFLGRLIEGPEKLGDIGPET